MQEYETTVTEKGQVTIPQEIRRLMGLHHATKYALKWREKW